MEFEWIIIIGVTTWLYWKWRKHTRIKRQKQKFENMRKKYINSAIEIRDAEAKKIQRKNICELAELVKELLNKYEKDITPRIMEETKKSMESYIEDLKFDKLHDLYKILSQSNRHNVHDNLKKFRG